MPYITASIVIQLLGMVRFLLSRRCSAKGKADCQKLNQYTRYLSPYWDPVDPQDPYAI